MKKFNTDKILFAMLFITLAIVILSQIGLVFPKTRGVFTNVVNIEGESISHDDTVKKGTLTLTIADGTPSEDIEILINGEKEDVFDTQTKEITLYETSVVEVYASNLSESACISIDGITNNLKDTTKLNEIKINNGFNMVGRFLLVS